jgi:Tfp pilus assembly protein PilF
VLRIFILALTACTPLTIFAQAKVDASKPVLLQYNSKSWNKDPQKEESGMILMRDARTGKMAQIQLLETTANSGVFIGSYSVSWGDKEIIPEIYLPPQDSSKGTDQIKKLENLIREGTLLRKPYFAKADAKNNQTIAIFDSKEQALEAFESYRRLHLQVPTTVGRAALEAQANAVKEREIKAQDQIAHGQSAERQQIDIAEKKKMEQLRKDHLSLNAQEKARREKLSQTTANEAMELFKQGKFPESEALYKKAIELNPTDGNLYFRYGVVLYRNEKYNQSLVVLDLANVSEDNRTERDFYTSLDLWKLKENDSASKGFQKVKAKEDKNFSSSAAFYLGLIHFERENYDPSKTEFEYVLDHSNDPAFDKQAETYIEAIANALAYKKEQNKRLLVSLNAGLVYDSNILAVSNSQLDQPTDLAGYRWAYGGILEYRALYTRTHELSAILSASDMYSTDLKFKAAQNFQNTDPLSVSVYIPYKYKGTAFNKSYQMTLSGGYEQLQMNADATGPRETIIQSQVLKTENTFGMNENWFSTYTLEYRNDVSLLDTSSSPSDNLSAQKWTLNTSQVFFQNPKKTEAWIAELGVAQNLAQGANAKYTRSDIAATYMAPWKWDTTWTARLGYGMVSYPEHTVGRADKATSLTLSLRKPLTETLAASLTGVYMANQSTLDSSDYRKYMIMTMLSWSAFR